MRRMLKGTTDNLDSHFPEGLPSDNINGHRWTIWRLTCSGSFFHISAGKASSRGLVLVLLPENQRSVTSLELRPAVWRPSPAYLQTQIVNRINTQPVSRRRKIFSRQNNLSLCYLFILLERTFPRSPTFVPPLLTPQEILAGVVCIFSD